MLNTYAGDSDPEHEEEEQRVVNGMCDKVRAAPLLRVKAKFTVKNAVCRSPRRQHPAFLTVILALTHKSGVALRCQIGVAQLNISANIVCKCMRGSRLFRVASSH